MSGAPIGFPLFQVFNNVDGTVLSSGKVRAFVAGTTTPIAIYTDSALSIPHDVPIDLGSAGNTTIYLDPAKIYKFEVKDSTDTSVIWTIDNVAAPFNPLSGGFGVGGDINIKDYSLVDNNTNDYIKFTSVAGGINHLTLNNAATGTAPKWTSTGTDTNVGETHVMKGTGVYTITGTGGLTLTNGPLNMTAGALTMTLGDFTMTSGNALLSSGNLTMTSGTFTITSGSALLSSGNLTLTSGNLILTSGDITSNGAFTFKDTNSNEILKSAAVVPSAVNEFTISNAATGGSPSLSVTGDDTNIPVLFSGKGTGKIRFGQATCSGVQLEADQPILDSSGNELLKFSKTASAVNDFTISNAATGGSPTISVTGDDADIQMFFQYKGNGGYCFLASSTASTEIKLYEDTDNGTNYIGLKAPASIASNLTYTLPGTDAAANKGEFLQSDGSGTISHKAPKLFPADGRLTTVTNDPIVFNAGGAGDSDRIYYTPYLGNVIALYNGSKWQHYSFSEIIGTPSVANRVHDVFIYDNAGTLTLDVVSWTNNTTRATALTKQDNIYVKSGDVTRRYLGTVCTDSATLGVADLYTQRHVWNYYNRIPKDIKIRNSATTWTYGTASWRPANNDSSLSSATIVVGVAEDAITANLTTIHSGDATARDIGTGLGWVSNNVISEASSYGTHAYAQVTNDYITLTSSYTGPIINSAGGNIGLGTLYWLEINFDAAGAPNFYGSSTNIKSGVVGTILC